jgi:protein disulfide-isomerase-like protein
MFAIPGCPACEAVKPDLGRAGRALAERAEADRSGKLIAVVDCKEEADLCATEDIEDLPTFKLYLNGEFHKIYTGSKLRSGILSAVDSLAKGADAKKASQEAEAEKRRKDWTFDTSVVQLSDGDFHARLEGATVALVMFYAPWCGHCRAAKPAFSDAGLSLTAEGVTPIGSKLMGVVDCTVETDLCRAKKIKSYPTFKLYSNGRLVEDYTGARNKDAFLAALDALLKEKAGPPASKTDSNDGAPALTFEEIEASADTFRARVVVYPASLVMFHAPWCGHCKTAKPVFLDTASALRGRDVDNRLAIAVDCTQYGDLCKEEDVSGYPTFRLYSNGGFIRKYTGARSKEGFLEALEDVATNHARPPAVNDVTFDHLQLKEHELASSLRQAPIALIMYYAPWCGHCKAAKEPFADAAQALVNSNEFGVKLMGAVDCTVFEELCKKEDVKGFPTIRLYVGGRFVKKHEGQRTKEAFLETINDAESLAKELLQSGAPPTPAAAEDFELYVTRLTSHNFEDILGRADRALVMFHAPWCGHCKAAKPAFAEAARQASSGPDGNQQQRSDVFASVDCTLEQDLCKKEELTGYPTFKIYAKGSFVEKYTGGRDAKSFAAALGGELKPGKEAKRSSTPRTTGEDSPFGPAVIELGAAEFRARLVAAETPPAAALVMFYAPWCGHCKRAKPAFSEAAAELGDDDKLLLAAVDCTKETALCAESEVRGYPTFRLYRSGKFVEKYTGGRGKQDFLDAIRGVSGNKDATAAGKKEEL